jgi:Fe-S cluster assembly protein SufD
MLDESVIRNLSKENSEPTWLLQARLNAFKHFNELPLEHSELFKKYAEDYAFDCNGLQQKSIHFELSEEARKKGVKIFTAPKILQDAEFQKAMNIFENRDKLSAFANAFFNTGYILYIPKDSQLDSPIYINFAVDSSIVAKNLIFAAANCNVAIVEKIFSENKAASFYASDLQIFAEESSLVEHYCIQNANQNCLAFVNKCGKAKREASIKFFAANFGSAKSRLRTNLQLIGTAASAENNEIIFGNRSQKFDTMTSIATTAAVSKGESHTRGLFSGRSSAVIKGQVLVEKGAEKADMYLSQHSILLTKDARANTIPCLEIKEENVSRATHSTSVSHIDEDHIFYLTSRGILEADARKLIILGFLEKLIRKIKNRSLQEEVSKLVEEKFGEENA